MKELGEAGCGTPKYMSYSLPGPIFLNPALTLYRLDYIKLGDLSNLIGNYYLIDLAIERPLPLLKELSASTWVERSDNASNVN